MKSFMMEHFNFGHLYPKSKFTVYYLYTKGAQKLIGMGLRIFHIWTTNPWYGGVYKIHGKSRLGGYINRYGGSPFSQYQIYPLFWGVLEAWMTFKKAGMAKTLKNGLCMIETNSLNHNWLDFVILSGLTLHQFQKKVLLSSIQTWWKGIYLATFFLCGDSTRFTQ